MFPHDEFKLTRQAIFAMLVSAAFAQTAGAAPAGTVVFTSGDVSATSIDGQVRPLLKGTDVLVGDTIVTGTDGRAQVRFTDGAFSSFQPGTRFRVDQYQYEGKTDGSEKGFFSLLKGALRTVTGAIGHLNKKNYQVATPTATIGIRGTEYLAREGNSLNVSVGEGQIEVCNAAGCLIVADGESAYVKDPSTLPIFIQLKTEAGPPPPPPPPNTEGYTVSENRDASGAPSIIPTTIPATLPPVVILPTLPSGPGYTAALAGRYTDPTNGATNFLVPAIDVLPANATFNAGGEMLTFVSPGVFSASSGVIAGGLSDGIIAWGRWDSGTGTDSTSSILDGSTNSLPLQDVHYVVGQPTPSADMVSLNASNISASYSLIGYTFPTALDSQGVRTVGTQPVTGSLSAYFGTGQINFGLNVPIGTQVFAVTDGYANIFASSFIGYGTTSTGCSGGSCVMVVSGLFAGANASRAGLVYEIPYTDIGTVNGAAAFSKTTTAPPIMPSVPLGYIAAMAGHYIDPTYGPTAFTMPGYNEQLPVSATFNAAGQLLSYSSVVCLDGCGYNTAFSATAGAISSGSADGVIGWGRWDSGNATDTNSQFINGTAAALQDVHYIVGQPTSASDMALLNGNNVSASYALIGSTFPTAFDGTTRTVGTQPVTGSLQAYFGIGAINFDLNVPIGGQTYAMASQAGYGSINGAQFSGSGFMTSASSGYSVNVNGLFVGANASRAGLVYQIPYSNVGVINGATAFTKTAVPPPAPYFP